MKKNLLLNFRLLLVMSLTIAIFISCDPDDDNNGNGYTETTVEEDRRNIQASFDRVQSLLENFRNGNFYSFAEEFLGAGPQDGYWWNWVGEGRGDYTRIWGYEYTPGRGHYNRVRGRTMYNSVTSQYGWWDIVEVNNGDFTIHWNLNDFVYTPGRGDHNRDGYHFYWVGWNNGNYTFVWRLFEYTPGRGNYNIFDWVGWNNGNYILFVRWEHTPGQGSYNRELWGTYFGFAVPEFTRLLGEQISEFIDIDDIEQHNRFRMATFAGSYTWNNATRRFDRVRDRNDIRVTFPIRENSAINGVFAITRYEDQRVDILGNMVYLPTRISAHFDRGNERISSVEAEASFTNFGIPRSASVSIFAKPITLTTTLRQETPSRYAATLEITDDTDRNNSLSVSGTASLSNAIDSYTDFADLRINNLIFTLTQVHLSIRGSIDFRTLNEIRNPSVADINSVINLQVFWRDNPDAIGSLRVQEVGDRRYLFIVYRDGTRENTRLFYDNFLIDIENMFMRR